MVSKALVLGIVTFAVIGWMGLGVTALANSATGASAAPAVTPAASSPAATLNGAGTTNVASAMAAHALAATSAAGLKSNVVFVPRPSATPEQIAHAAATGTVSPLYTGDPAPIGLGYYGLSGSGEGPMTGSIFNTTAVQGSVDANQTGIQGMDLFQSSPDSYGVQLNAVMTNVTLFGTGGYSFWTQNVVEYYPTAGFMVLVTNVWNFSGASISPNALYGDGGSYQVSDISDYGLLGYYYSEAFVAAPIAYPFNLTLTMTSGIMSGRDAVTFGVTLASSEYPLEDFSAPSWTYVIFNSLGPTTPALTVPSNYTANGLQYNAVGLTDDFELDICGPGGGSQVDLSTADASLGLAYYNATTLSFDSVPAAYSYGGETGETATGANVAWSNAPGGPAGLSDYGTMTTGPSILSGLWGTGAPEGSYPVTVAASPANAFNFFEYSGAPGFTTPIVPEYAYAPNMATDTFYLMPGTYGLQTELSNFAPVTTPLTISGPTTVPITLVAAPSLGIYTPLWAFSNAEVPAISSGGSGTPSSPYLLVNDQSAPILPSFGLYNDYGFPTFPGVFLYGTNVSTELYKPANLSASTDDFQFPGNELPQVNDLQFWFWGVSNVSIVDASNISGWFTSFSWYPLSFDTFNVVFYASSHNLVAGNTFDTQGQALLMFSAGTIFGPLNVGGGNNTVWGNHFFQTFSPTGCPSGRCEALFPYGAGIGLEVAENTDLIYNNYVATPTTAWLLPINLYSGSIEYFTAVRWNITPVAASVVNYAAGFPNIPLTGSIVGAPTQGGNFWWDYGLSLNPYNGANNPISPLPYDENAITLMAEIYGCSPYYCLTYIYPGGDYAPAAGYLVTFHESGLLPGTPWGVVVKQGSTVVAEFTTAGTSYVDTLPTGHYTWTPLVPTGYATGLGGSFTILHHSVSVGMSFHLAHGYSFLTFHETGLPPSSLWTFGLNGTTPATDAYNTTYTVGTPSWKLVVVDGTYDFSVPAVPGYVPSPSSGSFTITGPTTEHIRFHAATFALTFDQTGVPAGKHWGVRVSGPILGHGDQKKTVESVGSSLVFYLPNGTYNYTVLAPAHTTCIPASGTVTINNSSASVILVCTFSAHGGSPPPTSSMPPALPARQAVAARGLSA